MSVVVENQSRIEMKQSGRLRTVMVAVLVLMVVAGVGDLIMDAPRNWLSLHVAFELMMVSAAAVGLVALWLAWWGARQEVMELERSLDEQTADRDAWRLSAETALEGLGRAIDEQFDVWKLTPAEREVALLLLKGRSHKAIGQITGRSERTVRQHAATVYEKAGLAGRAELAAFFLEDVMLPGAAGAERGRERAGAAQGGG